MNEKRKGDQREFVFLRKFKERRTDLSKAESQVSKKISKLGRQCYLNQRFKKKSPFLRSVEFFFVENEINLIHCGVLIIKKATFRPHSWQVYVAAPAISLQRKYDVNYPRTCFVYYHYGFKFGKNYELSS